MSSSPVGPVTRPTRVRQVQKPFSWTAKSRKGALGAIGHAKKTSAACGQQNTQACRCQAISAKTDTQGNGKQRETTRQEERPQQPAPRSPFNTGSMDITTAGATTSLCGHPLTSEKTIVIVRHGMTTWNEEQRIQASTELLLIGCFNASLQQNKSFAGQL